ncbi:RNA-binding S4 domain-containing protein [Algivirga pacifica]|uniref:RNA-binding S4 domain-containing protein n=1 Tax=Algivirga pacifica TaxID=1162670 RepID=A0ABP9DEP5_9BACT
MRTDKYLWAVRLFKTRTMASNAIKDEQVLINDKIVKPSQKIEQGDEIKLYRHPIWRSYQVHEIIEKRVGASIAQECITETTSEEEIEKFIKYQEEKRFYLS